jgi:hypothetical protein
MRKVFISDQTDLVKKTILDDIFYGEQSLLLKIQGKVEDDFDIIRDFKGYKPHENLD